MSAFLEHWPPGYQHPNTPSNPADNSGSSEHATTDPVLNDHTAVWVQHGEILYNGELLQQGKGCYFGSSDRAENRSGGPAEVLKFIVSLHNKPTAENPAETGVAGFRRTHVLSNAIASVQETAFLRLDQVHFPPGAVAYRHTHPGPGIRYLVYGGLKIESEHATQTMTPGTAWFEDANSPVRATAIETEPSLFVRAMMLPGEFAGRSTLTLLDSEDKKKTTMQSNTRHFDQPLEWQPPSIV